MEDIWYMKYEELEKVKELYIQLKQFLEKYGNNRIINEYKMIQFTIKIIDSDLDLIDKCENVIHNYKAIFCSKGGLSEFNVWEDDFKKRKEINRPLDDIREDLWHIMRKYI